MDYLNSFSGALVISAPLMTLEVFSKLCGLELTVLKAQVSRGYWPTIRVGKRVFINTEVVRIKAAERAAEFAL